MIDCIYISRLYTRHVRAIFMLNGPGIVKNKTSERIDLVDVSATLAKIMGIDPPKNSEGRIIREAFLDLAE